MKLSRIIFILVLIYFVDCKNNVKSLTDSMGSEIIEIGTPIKELQELPPGVEEEPSAEADEEMTSKAPPQTATKRDSKRVATTAASTNTQKEVEKEDSVSHEEEEARIEKELAEIYKDTDYKSDSTDTINKELIVKKVETNVTEDKPIARSRINFKFQPDVNNRADIERFRTSVDEISCDRRVTQRLSASQSKSNTTSEFVMNFIQICLVVLALVVC